MSKKDYPCEPDEKRSPLRFICYLIGHRWDDWRDAGGRRVCERCDGRYCPEGSER